jgi:hypothetical protein
LANKLKLPQRSMGMERLLVPVFPERLAMSQVAKIYGLMARCQQAVRFVMLGLDDGVLNAGGSVYEYARD